MMNHASPGRFTPWQLIVSTLTGVYALRNIDKILGLGCEHPPHYYHSLDQSVFTVHYVQAPEPLARLVSQIEFTVMDNGLID
jgi:hypothetical protein